MREREGNTRKVSVSPSVQKQVQMEDEDWKEDKDRRFE